MKDTILDPPEAGVFATAALSLRFGAASVEDSGGHVPAPVTAAQLIEARRPEDAGRSVWDAYQGVQENMIQGGLPGRSANGRRIHTRPVASIDRSVSLNRALWTLATEMQRLRGGG